MLHDVLLHYVSKHAAETRLLKDDKLSVEKGTAQSGDSFGVLAKRLMIYS